MKAVERENSAAMIATLVGLASKLSEIDRDVRGSASGKKVHCKECSAAKQRFTMAASKNLLTLSICALCLSLVVTAYTQRAVAVAPCRCGPRSPVTRASGSRRRCAMSSTALHRASAGCAAAQRRRCAARPARAWPVRSPMCSAPAQAAEDERSRAAVHASPARTTGVLGVPLGGPRRGRTFLEAVETDEGAEGKARTRAGWRRPSRGRSAEPRAPPPDGKAASSRARKAVLLRVLLARGEHDRRPGHCSTTSSCRRAASPSAVEVGRPPRRPRSLCRVRAHSSSSRALAVEPLTDAAACSMGTPGRRNAAGSWASAGRRAKSRDRARWSLTSDRRGRLRGLGPTRSRAARVSIDVRPAQFGPSPTPSACSRPALWPVVAHFRRVEAVGGGRARGGAAPSCRRPARPRRQRLESSSSSRPAGRTSRRGARLGQDLPRAANMDQLLARAAANGTGKHDTVLARARWPGKAGVAERARRRAPSLDGLESRCV